MMAPDIAIFTGSPRAFSLRLLTVKAEYTFQ
jgi:hypothetical protein